MIISTILATIGLFVCRDILGNHCHVVYKYGRAGKFNRLTRVRETAMELYPHTRVISRPIEWSDL